MRRLAETLTAVIIAIIAMTYYGVQAETLTVQIETSIEHALAQVSIPIVALIAFIALAAILLLRLFIGKITSPWGFIRRMSYVGLTKECYWWDAKSYEPATLSFKGSNNINSCDPFMLICVSKL